MKLWKDEIKKYSLELITRGSREQESCRGHAWPQQEGECKTHCHLKTNTCVTSEETPWWYAKMLPQQVRDCAHLEKRSKLWTFKTSVRREMEYTSDKWSSVFKSWPFLVFHMHKNIAIEFDSECIFVVWKKLLWHFDNILCYTGEKS